MVCQPNIISAIYPVKDPLDVIGAVKMPLKQSTGRFVEDEVTEMLIFRCCVCLNLIQSDTNYVFV